MAIPPALAAFGAGRLFVLRTDIAGQTPVPFGVLQDCAFDMSFTTKPIMGSNQFAVFVARGEAKWTMKAKTGLMSGLVMNELFFGQTLVPGQTALAVDQGYNIPGSGNYTIIPAPPSSGVFASDEGVSYNGGVPLQFVSTLTAPGQYEQAGGVYTFDSADASAAVQIAFTYTFTGAGQKIAITNQALGTTPFFSGVFRARDPRSGLYWTLVINRMTSSKLSLASKTSDYEIPEFDAEIMDDGTGNIGTMSFADLS